MNKKSQKVTLLILIAGTILLGVTTLIISLQLQQRQPITDLPPRAASESCAVTFTVTPDVVPESCELSFALNVPGATPTNTGVPTNTPLATNTPTRTPTLVPTATPNPQCGGTCTTSTQCPSNHVCGTTGEFANKCVLTVCNANPSLCTIDRCSVIPTSTPTNIPTSTTRPTNTQIPTNTPTRIPTNTQIATNTPTNMSTATPTNTLVPTATPNPLCGQSCTANNQCPDDHVCPTSGEFANKCILTTCSINPSLCSANRCSINPTSTPTLTPTNTPAPGACSASCNSNSDCANNLVCTGGMCRNPECSEQPNCACYFVPTPQVPVTGSGTTLIGIGVIAGGIILLLLGLAF